MKAVGDKEALTEKTANGWLHVRPGADDLKRKFDCDAPNLSNCRVLQSYIRR